jgi:hypothetical protein
MVQRWLKNSARVVLLMMCAGIGAHGAFAQQGNKPETATELNAHSLRYVQPDFRQRAHSYLLNTFGPLNMALVTFSSAISQADDVPPDWGQGWHAYGERFASHLGSSMVGGGANLLLSQALREDTRYYPCTCKKIWPRVKHALISSITARAGEDGHRVLSIPAIASPYAGAFASLAWYPDRYHAMDAFRTGNYNLLYSIGEKVALEFVTPLFELRHHHRAARGK